MASEKCKVISFSLITYYLPLMKNIINKIWESHVVSQKPGHPAIFAIDKHFVHEVTSAQAFNELKKRNLKVKYPEKCVATLDHSIPTSEDRNHIKDPMAKRQVDTLRKNVKEAGIELLDFGKGQGIVHVIGPELGITQPGMTIVCGDSHTSTHGAFGAIAFGIGTTEVGIVLGTGCLLQDKPKTMKVEFKGNFQKGVYSKDAILALIAKIGVGGANGHIIEYTGEAIRKMNMEERMTVCNMSIECGARAGLISPDEVTFDYIKGRPYAPKGSEWSRAVKKWKTLASEPRATYDKEITIDVSRLQPMVTWGTNPSQGIMIDETIPLLNELSEEDRMNAQKALEYTRLKPGQPIAGTKIDWGFIGSCTNGRIEDLQIAAKILEGKKVHEDVTLFIVPGSEAVKKQAEAEGIARILKDAGAVWRNPGCSMCMAMNDDKVPDGKRAISSTNRNFIGRQGPGSITHLASPATVAASVIAGKITHPSV